MDTKPLYIFVFVCLAAASAIKLSHQARCNRGKSLGSCRGQPPRWVYNVVTGSCEAVPGGCPQKCHTRRGGCPAYANYNNFNSKTHCESACIEAPVETRMDTDFSARGYFRVDRGDRQQERVMWNSETSERAGLDTCSLPPVTGWCRASIRRWYYNESSGRCEIFRWGGCGGNENKFKTERKCRLRCGSS